MSKVKWQPDIYDTVEVRFEPRGSWQIATVYGRLFVSDKLVELTVKIFGGSSYCKATCWRKWKKEGFKV